VLWVKKRVLAPLCLELAAGVLVGVVDYFELAGVDVEDGSDEDVLELYACVFATFEEDAFVFEVELHEVSLTISMVLSFRKYVRL
jgi:hypothetical protein